MHPFIRPLTASILILALLSAGCTDTGGSSANSPAAVATAIQAATAEPTPEVTESHWWDNDPELVYGDYETSFFGNFEGIKNTESVQYGYYSIMNEDGDSILRHQDFPSFDPYNELQPEQARALEEQYGYPESVVMEQADTDGDGALDKVAVRYEGEGGKGFTHEAKYIEGESVTGYIADKIFFDTHGKHIYDVYDI